MKCYIRTASSTEWINRVNKRTIRNGQAINKVLKTTKIDILNANLDWAVLGCREMQQRVLSIVIFVFADDFAVWTNDAQARVQCRTKTFRHHFTCVSDAGAGFETPNVDIFSREYATVNGYRQWHRNWRRCAVDLLLHDFRQVTDDKIEPVGNALRVSHSRFAKTQRRILRNGDARDLIPWVTLLSLRLGQRYERAFEPDRLNCGFDSLRRNDTLSRHLKRTTVVQIVTSQAKRNVGPSLSSCRKQVDGHGCIR